jgi:hypothetical protein
MSAPVKLCGYCGHPNAECGRCRKIWPHGQLADCPNGCEVHDRPMPLNCANCGCVVDESGKGVLGPERDGYSNTRLIRWVEESNENPEGES